MSTFRRILPAFSHFCLALMLSVLANGVLFFHSHELANGKIITHAHPILTEEQESLPDHGHTETELITLDLISDAEYDFFVLEIPVPEIVLTPVVPGSVIFTSDIDLQTQVGFEHRGPPARA
ncbi:hypothetical protein [Mariniradius saccharolyticus]|nr:hypothetical protein [Mariniradius saccharolyticus]